MINFCNFLVILFTALFILLLLSAPTLSINTNAYSKTTGWVKVIGSKYEDYNVDVFFDINSSLYIVGEVSINGSTPQILVMKLSSEGDLRWAKTIDINNVGVLAIVPFVRIDLKGYIYIAGRISPSPFNISSPDIFVAKLNQVGEVLWAKVIDLQEPECVEGMYIDSNGFVYIVGATRYDIACLVGYAPCYIDVSYINIFIAKIDPEGNIVWIKSLDSGGYDIANSIAVDPLGYIYLGGATNIKGEWMYLIAKLNPSGDIVWVKTVDIGGLEYTRSIYIDSVDQIHLHGITFINESMYFVIIKLNRNGDFIQGKILPHAGVAYTAYNGVTYLAGAILTDTLFMKLDVNLDLVWAKIVYNPKIELPVAIYVNNNNDIYVVSSIISQVAQGMYRFEDILIAKWRENTTIPRIIDVTEDLYTAIRNLDSVDIADSSVNVLNPYYRLRGLTPIARDFTNNIIVKVLETAPEIPTITLTFTQTLITTIPTTITTSITVETTAYKTITTVTPTTVAIPYTTTFTTTHRLVLTETTTSRETRTLTYVYTSKETTTNTIKTTTTITTTYTYIYRETVYLRTTETIEKTRIEYVFPESTSLLVGLSIGVAVTAVGAIYLRKRLLL